MTPDRGRGRGSGDMLSAGSDVKTSERSAKTAKDRLKQAACRLFAAHGFDGVTVRDILSEAGERNGASISYYFGSKEGLINQIAEDTYLGLDRRWSEGLRRIEASGEPQTLRQLLALLVDTALFLEESGEQTTNRVSEALVNGRYHLVLKVVRTHHLTAFDEILARIAAHLTDLPEAVGRKRLIFLMRYLSTMFALFEHAAVAGTERQRIALSAPNDHSLLIDTAIGLLTAPVGE